MPVFHSQPQLHYDSPNPANILAADPALAKEIERKKQNTTRKGTRLHIFSVIGGYVGKWVPHPPGSSATLVLCWARETVMLSVNRRDRG
jgi:hypothetical protein